MSSDTELKRKAELVMYGCTNSDLVEMYDMARRPAMGGTTMLAMSILSDAQEAIACGDTDTARQYINRAKWVIKQCES